MRAIGCVVLLLTTCVEAAPRIGVVGSGAVDFGNYPAAEKKTATYRVKNTGDGVLRVLKIRKGCGCSTAKINKTVLGPGETGIVEVVILPNSIFGAYAKSTYVESTDPKKRFLKLGVSGNAVPAIAVKPKASIHVGRLPLNKPLLQVFEISGAGAGLKLGDPRIQSSHPQKINISSRESGGSAVQVSITPGSQSGDLSCSVTIPVLSPTNQPPITLTIIGQVGQTLRAVPATLHIPLSHEPVEKKFYLRILGASTHILKRDELDLPEIAGVSFNVSPNNQNRGLLVTAIFTPDFTKELLAKETIPLAFAVPGAASAKLACKIER